MKKSVLAIIIILSLIFIPLVHAVSFNQILSNFFDRITGSATTGSCTDTDVSVAFPDGKDYGTKGTIEGISDDGKSFGPASDSCDRGRLSEWYCDMSTAKNYNREYINCPAGTSCSDGACVSSTPACSYIESTCPSWSTCSSGSQYCTATNCNSLTRICTTSICNYDGTCDSGETILNCPSDCATTPVCNTNGTCDSGETILNCPSDCATCSFDTVCKTGCSTGDSDCTCLQQTGHQCITGQTCSLANQLTHSGTGICCYIACTSSVTTPTCSSDSLCKSDCNNGDPDCICSEESGYSCTTASICTSKGGISLVHSGTGICCSADCTILSQNKAPYTINITTFPSGSIPASSIFSGSTLKINGTITINDSNGVIKNSAGAITYAGDKLNVSFVWYEDDIIIKSDTIGRVSMPNATNVIATGNGKVLRVPYNLTDVDYSLGHSYKLGIYLCDGIVCNQSNSSIVSTGGTANSVPYFINITTFPANITTKESGLSIKVTVTLNDLNLEDRLNISYTWYDLRPGSSPSVIVNISNTTGKHSMPNATNIIPIPIQVVLMVPYNLTDYDIGRNYTLGVYACDGKVCNQINSSMINITTAASLPACIAPNDLCIATETCTGNQVLHSGAGVCCSTTCITTVTASGNGCIIGTDRIVPVSTRANINTASSYCDLDYSWKLQKSVNVACQNDYECDSNTCKGNKCLDVTKFIENVGLLKKIWCKIINPLSTSNYDVCLIT